MNAFIAHKKLKSNCTRSRRVGVHVQVQVQVRLRGQRPMGRVHDFVFLLTPGERVGASVGDRP